jgi:hypothetical protein
MMKAARRVAGLALVLAVVACNETVAPGESFQATFALETIGGQPLPFVTSDNILRRVEVAGGSIQVRADGTYTETLALQSVYPSGDIDGYTVVEQGTYTVRGRTLAFTASQGGTTATAWQATMDGDALSYTQDGNVFLYRRQAAP